MAAPFKVPAVDIVSAVHGFASDHGYPPTYRELAEMVGLSLSAIHVRVDTLVRMGLMERKGNRARCLTVTDSGLSLIIEERGRLWSRLP